MRSVILLLISLSSIVSFAQRAQRLMFGVQADLIKSDNDGFFEKLQGGIEGNFYISRKIAATAGVEGWTDDRVAAVLGARFCPIDEAFLRIRVLPGKDFSIGAGFGKFLSGNVRFEAMSDLYLEGHIAIRAGIAFGIGKSPQYIDHGHHMEPFRMIMFYYDGYQPLKRLQAHGQSIIVKSTGDYHGLSTMDYGPKPSIFDG